MSEYFTPEELSERYGSDKSGKPSISVKTLAQWRCSGRGPKFVKIGGKVLYRIADVTEWEVSRTSGSTTEHKSKARKLIACVLSALAPIKAKAVLALLLVHALAFG